MRLLILLLIVISIEVVLIAKVGSLIGFFYTFLLIILTAVIGSWQLKKQWRFVMSKLQTLQSEPSQAVLEAFILLLCGIFLITPGFLTDILGFLGLIPLVRERLVESLQKHSGRFTQGQFAQGVFTQGRFRQHTQQSSNQQQASKKPQQGQIIEGEFKRKDD